MKRIQDFVGRELKWTQPRAMKRAFELRDGEEVVANLRWRSMFGSLVTAETADGSWTFKRVGCWRTHVSICPLDSRNEAEQSLVQFTRFGGPFHMSSIVTITEAAAELAELPWIVALGWYLAVKMQDDASGAAAGAAAAAG